MTGPPSTPAPGATPLDPNELAGLIPRYLTTQAELNLLEQGNILEARSWLARSKRRDPLDEAFIKRLHRRMFDHVWRWAGSYRLTDKSIGVPWQQVPVEVRKLCDDTRYWIEHHSHPWDELGARFHHRLVLVHAFPNGNGRHARLMTDALLAAHAQPAFTWGRGATLEAAGAARSEYLLALREADARKLDRLIAFVRS